MPILMDTSAESGLKTLTKVAAYPPQSTLREI